MLGTLLLMLLAFAALMVFLDGRAASQGAAATATATEMQMLSQRLARGSAIASQGQAAAFPAVKDSRERFGANLDALLQRRRRARQVARRRAGSEASSSCWTSIKTRWSRVDVAAGRLLDNEKSLTTLAKGLDGINQGNNAILELAQQAAQQIGQGGGTLRDLEFANQLAVLSQRIAKNANALASGDEVDPEVAFLLGKDTARSATS